MSYANQSTGPVVVAKTDDLHEQAFRRDQRCDLPLFSRDEGRRATHDDWLPLPPMSNTGVSDTGVSDDDWLDDPVVADEGNGQSPPVDIDPWKDMAEDRWRFRIHWLTLTVVAEDGWSDGLPDIVMAMVSTALSRTPASRSDWRTYRHASYGYTEHATGLLGARLDWVALTQTKEGHEHMSLSLPGQWCDAAGFAAIRKLVDDLTIRFGVRCTRLDLAFDTDLLRVGTIKNAALAHQFTGAMQYRPVDADSLKSSIEFVKREWLASYNKHNRTKVNRCLRLGSYQSQRFVRVYDRRGDARLEMQVQEDMAQRHFNHLLCSDLEGVDVAWQALGCVRAYIDFVDRPTNGPVSKAPLLRWWKRFVKGSEIVKLPPLPKADADARPALPDSSACNTSRSSDAKSHSNTQGTSIELPDAIPPSMLGNAEGEYHSIGSGAVLAPGQQYVHGQECVWWHRDHIYPVPHHRSRYDDLMPYRVPPQGHSGGDMVGYSANDSIHGYPVVMRQPLTARGGTHDLPHAA